MGRLLKLGIIVAAIAGLVVVGKKLMGGLGPEPGSDLAPKEWPSLVPEPTAAAATPATNGSGGATGNGSGAPTESTDAGEAAESVPDEPTGADATSD